MTLRLFVTTCWICLGTHPLLSHATKCGDLVGFWYNQLGSEMLLNHSTDGLLTGEYRTAVERRPGTAGTSHSLIVGAAPYNKPGSTFGFSVLWRGGASTTAWTAQCVTCGEEEVIYTSWVLRSRVDACIDRWRSTRIGQDAFTRAEQRVGPRRRFGTHTPQDFDPNQQKTVVKRDLEVRRQRLKRQTSGANDAPCSLVGTTWYNLIGSKVTLTETADNILQGTYHTPREAHGGSHSGRHSDIHGVGNADITNNTFAMFLVWDEGQSVTGWVGQCLVCEEGNKTVAVLQMTWLHRTRVDSCDANWRSTRHGENTFYTQPQTLFEGVEQSEDLIGEFGEETVFDRQKTGASEASRPPAYITYIMAVGLAAHLTRLMA